MSSHVNTPGQAPRSVRDLDDGQTPSDGNAKVCRLCGKDLRGHKRYKDKDGYLCRECNADDLAQRIPCAECGTPTLPHALHPWGPISICASCKVDHENDPQKKFRRKVSTKKIESHERNRVLLITAVVLAAGLLLVLGRSACG